MAKTIQFDHNGKHYTLEFNRKTVKMMEATGFAPDELATKPATMLPRLFAGAFLMHHKGLRQDIIDELYDLMTDRERLFQRLAEMYNEPIEALLAEPEEGNEGNVTWTES